MCRLSSISCCYLSRSMEVKVHSWKTIGVPSLLYGMENLNFGLKISWIKRSYNQVLLKGQLVSHYVVTICTCWIQGWHRRVCAARGDSTTYWHFILQLQNPALNVVKLLGLILYFPHPLNSRSEVSHTINVPPISMKFIRNMNNDLMYTQASHPNRINLTNNYRDVGFTAITFGEECIFCKCYWSH